MADRVARGAAVLAAVMLVLAAVPHGVKAEERRDERHFRRPPHRDWHGGGYPPPPLAYAPPYAYAPPVVYGPGIGINLPGGVSIGIP